MSVTQLRPLGIGEILDVGITIYRRNFRALLTLVFVVVAPFEILSALLQASALPDTSFLTDTSATEPVDIDREFWLGVAAFGAAGVLSFIAGLVATGACFKAIADGYLGERADWRPFRPRRAGREAREHEENDEPPRTQAEDGAGMPGPPSPIR